MRLRSTLFAVGLCLLAAPSTGSAQIITNFADKRPALASRGLLGFELGPACSVPLPTQSASPDAVGLDAGMSFTLTIDRGPGIGVDVAYHHWPVSTAFKDAYNDFLMRETIFPIVKLGGSTWNVGALQYTVHLKFETPSRFAFRPWLQFGVGNYKVDPRIIGYNGNAGFFTIRMNAPEATSDVGYYLTTGLDLPGASYARMGLDASYHHVACAEHYGKDLAMISIGGHILFGR